MLRFLLRLFLVTRLLRPLLRRLALPMLFAGGLVGLRKLLQKEIDLHDQVVLITGSSRGLGLALARAFADEGCRLVICARDEGELEKARHDLQQRGAKVLALICDVSRQEEVAYLVSEATRHFGRVDILVNNAGIIMAGPLRTMTVKDFEAALDVIFWGTLYPTLALLPQMRKRGAGRIVNITSIGGKVSIPHLLPYTAAKFAAVGLSEGLRTELKQEGIVVTTIVPGLMRTGGYLNALFKGQQDKEFAWFAIGDSLPLLSLSATRAARQIVAATKRGEAERTLSLPAILLARSHGLFPGLVTDIAALVGQWILPETAGSNGESKRGMVIQAQMEPTRKWLLERVTALNLNAAQDLNQFSKKQDSIDVSAEERSIANEPS